MSKFLSKVKSKEVVNSYDYDPSTISNCIGLYNFTNTTSLATDTSGLGRNGTNNSVTSVAAVSDGTRTRTLVADFTGGAKSITLNSYAANYALPNFSISFWFKIANLGTNVYILNIDDGTTSNYFQVSTTSNKMRLLLVLSGVTSIDGSTNNTYADNLWHHCAVGIGNVFGNRIYIDGSNQTLTYTTGSSGSTGGISFTPTRITIGAVPAGFTGSDYTGNLDTIAFYSKTLTNSEQSALNAEIQQNISTVKTNKIVNKAGTVTNPSYTFENSENSGLYEIGTNNIGLAINGIKYWDYNSTNTIVSQPLSISNTTVPNFGSMTGALTLTGGIALNGANGTTKIHFGNVASGTQSNKMIALYDNFGNDYQFYGLGINSAIMRYSVDGTTSDHVFYAGLTSSTEQELFRVKGNQTIQLQNGTAAIPSLSFINDTSNNTGFYRIAEDSMGITTGGKLNLQNTFVQPSTTVPFSDSGLIAYYSFRNSLTTDTTANNYTLTNNGTVTTTDVTDSTNGVTLYNCATFNGSSQYLSRDTSVDTNLRNMFNNVANVGGSTNRAISISLWIYNNNSVTIGDCFCATSATGAVSVGTDQTYLIYYNGSNSLVFSSNTTTTATYIQANYTISQNQWYHIVISYSLFGLYLYVNGILTPFTSFTTGTEITAPVALNNINRIYIGSRNTTNYWNGSIKNVMISSSVLTMNQVKQIYNTQLGDVASYTNSLYAFTGDLRSGMLRTKNNTFSIMANGVDHINIDNAGVNIPNTNTLSIGSGGILTGSVYVYDTSQYEPPILSSNVSTFTSAGKSITYNVTSSTLYGAGSLFAPFAVFDNNTTTYWHSGDSLYNDTTGVYSSSATTLIDGTSRSGDWLQIDMGRRQTFSSFTIRVRTSFETTRGPNLFYMAGSNDGSTWSSIYTSVQNTITWSSTPQTFTISTDHSYRFFRLVISIVGNSGITTGRGAANISQLTFKKKSNAIINGTMFLGGSTITDIFNVASSTIASTNLMEVAQSTLSATNASVTTTRASSIYLAGAPIKGTNSIFTNAYGLYIDSAVSTAATVTEAASFYIANAPTVTSGTTFAMKIAAGVSNFATSTASTSNTTGAIITAGGIGISNTTDATSNTNGGSITTAGGLAVAKKTFMAGPLSLATDGYSLTRAATIQCEANQSQIAFFNRNGNSGQAGGLSYITLGALGVESINFVLYNISGGHATYLLQLYDTPNATLYYRMAVNETGAGVSIPGSSITNPNLTWQLSDSGLGFQRESSTSFSCRTSNVARLTVSTSNLTSSVPILDTDVTNAVSTTTGSMILSGGLGVAKTIYANNIGSDYNIAAGGNIDVLPFNDSGLKDYYRFLSTAGLGTSSYTVNQTDLTNTGSVAYLTSLTDTNSFTIYNVSQYDGSNYLRKSLSGSESLASLFNTAAGFSISMWVYHTSNSVSGGVQALFSSGITSTSYFEIYLENSTGQFTVRNQVGTASQFSETSAQSINTWVHYIVTFTTSGSAVYRNGVQLLSGSTLTYSTGTSSTAYKNFIPTTISLGLSTGISNGAATTKYLSNVIISSTIWNSTQALKIYNYQKGLYPYAGIAGTSYGKNMVVYGSGEITVPGTTIGSLFNVCSSTITTSSNGDTALCSIQKSTIAASSSQTTNKAATLYIQGSPIAGTNQTITMPYSLQVASGKSVFEDQLFLNNGTTALPSLEFIDSTHSQVIGINSDYNQSLTSWTAGTIPSGTWNAVCWAPEITTFVAVSTAGEIASSTNGTTWVSRTAPSASLWLSVTWSPELHLFVAISGTTGATYRCATSVDGITWIGQEISTGESWRTVKWISDLKLFVAIAITGTNRVAISSDGYSWSYSTIPEANQFFGLEWSPELKLLVVVSSDGTYRVMTSPDAIHWTSRSAAAAIQWYDIAWSSKLGLFAAVAIDGTSNGIMTSTDGISWTTRTSPQDNEWRHIEWVDELGMFICVASSGTNRIMYSANGTSWSLGTLPQANIFYGWTWAPELNMAVVVSRDGTNRLFTTSSPHSISIVHKAVEKARFNSAQYVSKEPILIQASDSNALEIRKDLTSGGKKLLWLDSINSNLYLNGNIELWDNGYKKFGIDSSRGATTSTNELIINDKLSTTHKKYTSPYPSNVIAYYDFADKYFLGRDVSGNGYHGVNAGVSYTSVSNGRSNVITFSQNGGIASLTNQRIDLSEHLHIFQKMRNISVSLWFRTSTTGTTRALFGFTDKAVASTDWLIFIENTNTVCFQIRQNNTVATVKAVSPGTVTDGNWHHVVATTGNATVSFYLDNVEVTNYTLGNTSSTLSVDSITITDINIGAGRDNDAGWEFGMNGDMADLIIFNEQINTTVISDLYNNIYGYDVYALMGQSNMVGRGVIVTGIDDNYELLNSKVYQYPFDANDSGTATAPNLTGATITLATNPLDHISDVSGGSSGESAGQTGLWKTFAETIVNSVSARRRILLVPVAKGGTSFSSGNWTQTGTSYIYTAAKLALNKALSLNSMNSLKGILWHQGESDADVSSTVYGAYLNNFYEALKTDITGFNSNIPFIMGGIRGSSAGMTQVNVINFQLKNYANADKQRYYVDTMDLEITDTYHYSAAALRTMGYRYGNIMLQTFTNKSDTLNSSKIDSTVTQTKQLKITQGVSFSTKIVTTTQYVLQPTDFMVEFSAESDVNVYLPKAVNNPGRQYHIIKTGTSGTGDVIINIVDTDTIDGSLTILTLANQYDRSSLISNGNGVWYSI